MHIFLDRNMHRYYNFIKRGEIMLKRKVMTELKKWKNESVDKALIVNGARQVGKIYIVREFGKDEYESFIELNFIEHPEYTDIFAEGLSAEDILTGIRLSM